MSLHTFDPSATFRRPPTSPMHRFFVPTGEFCGFYLVWGYANISGHFFSDFHAVSIAVHARAWDRHIFNVPRVIHLASALNCELAGFCSSGCTLMTSAILAVGFASIQSLCTCVHVPDAFVSFPGFFGSSEHVFRLFQQVSLTFCSCSPMCGFASLVGTFGIADV